jgi:hypothetical protein
MRLRPVSRRSACEYAAMLSAMLSATELASSPPPPPRMLRESCDWKSCEIIDDA